jgi:hypothetical protein
MGGQRERPMLPIAAGFARQDRLRDLSTCRPDLDHRLHHCRRQSASDFKAHRKFAEGHPECIGLSADYCRDWLSALPLPFPLASLAGQTLLSPLPSTAFRLFRQVDCSSNYAEVS